MQKLAQLVIEGDYDQVRQLATAGLVNARDEGGRTVLMLAADADSTQQLFSKCIKYALHLGADAKAADLAGNTAAHVAAGRNNLQMLALLPFEAKWLANKESVTPLMEAVQKRSLKCAKHLLHLFRQGRYFFKHNKSELLGMKNRNQQTALDIARASGQTDLVSIIELEIRLVITGEEREPPGTWRLTGLSESEAKTREELDRLAEAGDVHKLLVSATSVSCDLPDADGRTPLMLAAKRESGSDKAVQLLLSGPGADATCASLGGYSCLHWAAWGGRAGAAGDLLAAGAHADARDADGCTPLIHAVRYAPAATAAAFVQALRNAGADWSLRDSEGWTALDWAKSKKCTELVTLLNSYSLESFFNEALNLTLVSPVSSEPDVKKWDKVRLLGRGGCGEVHEALTGTGLRCAAKIIKIPVQMSVKQEVREKIDKFVEGEKILCELQHDNIVKFLYITELDEDFTIVLFMELLNGESLDQMLNNKPTDEVTIRHFSIQICNALYYLHSQQPPIIHRDIKPSNIMVTDSRQIKLIDFGLSTKLSATNVTHQTGTSAIPKGTANFMAPEMFGSEDPDKVLYSKESDIWAFGCTVYYMITGSVPNAGCDIVAIFLRLDRHGAPQLPDQCSALLRNFYQSCVAKKRDDRKSADDLLKDEFLKRPNT